MDTWLWGRGVIWEATLGSFSGDGNRAAIRSQLEWWFSFSAKPLFVWDEKRDCSEPQTISFRTVTAFWPLSSACPSEIARKVCVCLCEPDCCRIILWHQKRREPVSVPTWAVVPKTRAHEWVVLETVFLPKVMNLNHYLPKAVPAGTITLRVKTLTGEFTGGHKHSFRNKIIK